MPPLPNISFGEAGTKLPDWRKDEDVSLDDDSDDELAKTPDDVIELLGFDPLDEDEDVSLETT